MKTAIAFGVGIDVIEKHSVEMTWSGKGWLCPCGHHYTAYTTFCSRGCGKDNMIDGKNRRIF